MLFQVQNLKSRCHQWNLHGLILLSQRWVPAPFSSAQENKNTLILTKFSAFSLWKRWSAGLAVGCLGAVNSTWTSCMCMWEKSEFSLVICQKSLPSAGGETQECWGACILFLFILAVNLVSGRLNCSFSLRKRQIPTLRHVYCLALSCCAAQICGPHPGVTVRLQTKY